ncbi:MAG TPA: hypothetical protein VMF55_01170, partial [Solirubrobacterales bacterium]|nr:hypothetical protein [Solirubrobacterales bacterium]
MALTCLATMVFGAGIARAELFYSQIGELEGSSLPGWPEKYSAGALQESTGYVFDVNSSAGEVFVFESDEPGAGVLTTFGEGELSSPAGIAIDQTDNSIYIADAGNNRIVRYTSNGATPPVYTRDTTYTSPAHGSGSGEIGDFAAQLAFDPSTDDLLVADTGNKKVERFDSSGAFVGSFDGSTAPTGPFTSLNDVAPGADGTIYVIADGTINDEFFSSETTGSVVEHFDADGNFLEAVALQEYEGSARTLAFDTYTNRLLVATNRPGSLTRIMAFRNGAKTQELATNPEGVYVIDLVTPVAGPGNVISINMQNAFYQWAPTGLWNAFNLEPVIGPISAVTGTSAHLTGTINTNEATEVTVHFEYRVVGESNWTTTPDQGAAATSTPEPVEADISGLLPAKEYEARLSATRPGLQVAQPGQSSVWSSVTTFETEIVAPAVSTQGATGITGSAATLIGSVNAEGSPTTYYFEYGPTTNYGFRVPAGEAPAGNGRVPHRFTSSIAGLSPGTTYHFRIVAKNAAGSSFGDDVEFTTPATPPPNRAYEQVTPVDQQGGNINGALGVEALPDAEGISYVTTPVGGDALSAPKEARVLSLRGATDWGPQIHVDPPFNVRTGLNFALTAAVSDDGTHALVASNRALAPGGAEGSEVMNFYVKDIRDGSYAFVAKVEGENAAAQVIKELRHTVMAASPDFSWIVFWSGNSLLPGTPESDNRETNEGKGVVYRWSVTGGLEVASKTSGSVQGMRYLHWQNLPLRQVSTDGQRIFFQQEGGVFLREGGHTEPVSVSEIDDSVQPAELIACSESGRYVFFMAGRLTPDAPEGQQSLYRYDVDSKNLEFASAEVPINWERILGVSPDGSTIYWIAGFGGGQTMMWRNGEQVALPSPIGGPLLAGVGTLEISANSRYAGIQVEPSSPYSRSDVYLWNAET